MHLISTMALCAYCRSAKCHNRNFCVASKVLQSSC